RLVTGARPRTAVPQLDRAEPDRLDGDVLEEPVEELLGPLQGDLDVLDHPLLLRSTAPPVDGGDDAAASLQVLDLPVEVTAQPLPRPDPAQRRDLRAERPGAPEPVGVPAPQIVPDGEHAARPVLDRAVVDLLAGVVARLRLSLDLVRPATERQVGLGAAEDHAVEEVDRLPVPVAGCHDVADRVHRVGEPG